ncbi:hypothetical protein JST56_06910 [Candidatus Dependentiae bacterium]|nr:hypothetical protein [Candidatus Dependentiae bacterium]
MKKAFVGFFFISALFCGTLLSIGYLPFGQEKFTFQYFKSGMISSKNLEPKLSYFLLDNDLQQSYTILCEKFQNNTASILVGVSSLDQLINILFFLEVDDSTPHTLYISHLVFKNNSANKLMRLLKDLLCIIKRVDSRDKEVHLYLPEYAQSLKKSLLKKSKRDDSWVCSVMNDEFSLECQVKLCSKRLSYVP